jgi:error-prone DNA polymerase
MLHGMSSVHAERIQQVRGAEQFISLDDFTRRTGLSRAVTARLAKAGAFGSLDLDRRGALWHALAQDQKELPLFDHRTVRETDREEENEVCCTHPALPKMSPAEEVLADYRTTGLSLKAHPVQFLRQGLDRLGVAPAEKLKVLPNGKPVRVAGIVLVRQRPGMAKGITFPDSNVFYVLVKPEKLGSPTSARFAILPQLKEEGREWTLASEPGPVFVLVPRGRSLCRGAPNRSACPWIAKPTTTCGTMRPPCVSISMSC